MQRSLVVILFLGFMSLFAQIDFGQLKGNCYHNSYLDITVEVPENWWLRVKEDLTVRTDTGFKDHVWINKNLQRNIPIDSVSNLYLFMLQKFNPNLRIKRFIPTVFLTLENISKAQLRDVGQYLFKAREGLKEQTDIDYEFESGFKPLNIRQDTCYYMDVKARQGNEVVRQRFVSFFKNEFAVSFVLVYQQEKELEELMKILTKAKI